MEKCMEKADRHRYGGLTDGWMERQKESNLFSDQLMIPYLKRNWLMSVHKKSLSGIYFCDIL